MKLRLRNLQRRLVYASLVRFFACLWILSASTLLIAAPLPQELPPVGTLVPPTLVPVTDLGQSDMLLSESTVAQILREGSVRIGVLFNEPGFGELSPRADENGNPIITGFDADLGRAMAEMWGVSAALTQVTRQTSVDMLATGQIDMLISAEVHLRSLDERIEFSQTYYPNTIAMAVRDGDESQQISNFVGRPIGFVVGTLAENAVNDWMRRYGLTFDVRAYLNLDQALSALNSGEVDGVAGFRLQLARMSPEGSGRRLILEPVMPAPYAIGVRRQDVNMRNLVNRTLQFFSENGRLDAIHTANFSGVGLPEGPLISWANLGSNAPTPADFATDIPYPAQYVLPRLQSEHVIRVAGLQDLGGEATESERRLDAAHRALINAFAERWGVTVVYIPNSASNALELVANGEADLAVNVVPDWAWADRVDFTGHYYVHGMQMLVENSRNIGAFSDLRTRAIGIFNNEPGAAEYLVALARSANVLIDDPYIIREADAAFSILTATDINLDAVFGDSMKFVAHLEANPNTLSIMSRPDGSPWFTRYYMTFAVPRNDLDFRLLVEYTMQEMILDGSLQAHMGPVMRFVDAPLYDVWPGPETYLGFNLRR